MQKLGKKLPDHLQKPAWILMTEFYGHKNLITRRKIGQSCTLFSKNLTYGFVGAFWISRMQCIRLFPSLVRSGHNHRSSAGASCRGRPVTTLGHRGGRRRILWERPKFFKLFKLCPTHFLRGAKKFAEGALPPCTPWLRPV